MAKSAIITTGGKQYLVHEGQELNVEKLPESIKSLPDLLNGKDIPVSIVSTHRSKKIRVLKFRAKSRYKRVAGHRQTISRIKIGSIT